MALQVWLPLNDNLNNYGLTGVSLSSGTPTYTSGKIGYCLSAGALFFNVQNNLITTLGTTNKYTMCCWCKNLSTSASARWVFHIGGGGQGTTRGLWESNSTNSRHWAYSGTGVNMNTSINTIDGNWHHICFTSNVGVVTLYVDGVYQSQITNASTTAMAKNEICLNANNYNLNDFRLYDHVLSPREIKRIAQGLVLHYPLSNSSRRDNNIKRSSIVNRGCTSLTYDDSTGEWTAVCPVSTSTWGVGFYINDSSIKWAYGETWIISMEVYVPQSIGWNCDINNKPDLADISSYTGNDYDITGQRLTYTNGVNSKTLQAGWNKIWFSQTASSSTYGLSNYSTNWGIVTSSLSSSITVKFRNIKGEIIKSGEVIGPSNYIPNNSDVNYPSNIIYDVSGYNNNGNINGAIDYSNDTPRYNISTIFNGSSYIFNTTKTIHLSNEFTISWWGKINSWKKNWEGMFLLQNTTALDGANGTYSVGTALNANNANSMTLTIRQGGSTYPLDRYAWTYSIGTWAYYACTYKAGVVIMYQNGVQVYTATISDSSSSDYYYTIGRRGQNSDCQMSDFRIYATALSADDILELYKTPSYLASNAS